MASCKGPIRAYINQAVHTAFPPERVDTLQKSGEFHHELNLWTEFMMEGVPSQWWRDWESMAYKYAISALLGESGVMWEPKRVLIVYTGDLALCQVGDVFGNTKLRRRGGYGGRNGRVLLTQWYEPEQVHTNRQGDGDVAIIDGEIRRISWTHFGPVNPNDPDFTSFDDWLMDWD